ncbi:PTS sugar transporter subunit IIA [uncultured Sneathia sp.]|uniref:BglG family transcription antiterminator n=1 Tax=uncultured Sneathia sp. TaxID=278067 RepID=UPI00259BC280|nr:PTS sugar transporter subunit IIA [uncultured Sneathia sp.]
MLNNREILILQFLINVKKTNIYTLVDKYSVSESTVRYNIKNINSVFEILKIPKIKIKNNEIELNSNDEFAIKKFLKEEIDVIFSKEERKLLYIFKLLFTHSFNITHIADLLYISRMTVKNDLYELEKDRRISYQNKTYRVIENNEISNKTNTLYSIMKNNKLKALVIDEIDINKWEKIYRFIDLTKEILEINFNFTDMLYVQCLIYVIVFYCENNIENKVLDIANLDSIVELENSYKYLFGNNKNFNLIMDTLIGLSLNYSLDNWVNESIFVKKLIYSISKDISIDLTKDKVLFEFLCFHIKSCIYRLRKNIFLEACNYIDLVEKNEIYFSVKSNINEIEKIYQIQFNEEEIALITFHISSSIERQNKDRKTVILVCGLGYGTSKILSEKLNEIFNIDIVGIISVYELKRNYDKYKDVDYIISTINIDFVNSISITPLLNNNDQEKLIKYGLKINRKKIELNKFFEDIDFMNNSENLKEIIMEKYPDYFYIEKQNHIKSLFEHFSDKKIIFSNETSNYKQAIYKACKPLIDDKSITNEYYIEILKLISDYGPYMFLGNKIAVVHASSKNVNKNDMSILISRQKISIENKSANIIICFATLNDHYHKILLNSILNILDNEEIIEEIISKNNIDELKNITK